MPYDAHMTPETIPQFSAVYAEAAVAWLETDIPQAILWFEDEARWDFTPADEELKPSEVAFILQAGWDALLALEAGTDPMADDYDSSALADEIARQLEDEGVARSLLESLRARQERLHEGDGDDDDAADADDAHFSRRPMTGRDDI